MGRMERSEYCFHCGFHQRISMPMTEGAVSTSSEETMPWYGTWMSPPASVIRRPSVNIHSGIIPVGIET